MRKLLIKANPRIVGTALAATLLATTPLATAQATGGDLLIAPTRIMLDGRRGTEVILNNIGNEEATEPPSKVAR